MLTYLSWNELPDIQNRIDPTTKLKQLFATYKCLMETNKEGILMTSVDNQKAFDADKAETFSKKAAVYRMTIS